MDILIEIKNKLAEALAKLGKTVALEDITIEHSKSADHGDYSSNVAMKFAKDFHKNPRDIATEIINNLDQSLFKKVEIAGPGFINFFLNNDSLSNSLKAIIELGDNYGKSENNGKKVNVEFVSANPTGNLHVGHARIAALGDSISRLYEWAGYDVTREFYVNDAGSQIDHLAESIYARYMELLGVPTPIPQDGYAGADIIDIAKDILEEYGTQFKDKKEESLPLFKKIGIKKELAKIDKDLELFRVKFDVYSSESDIRSGNAIEKTLELYKDYSYIQEGALFLKTSAFLDDKDRAVRKSNGEYTYFMPDIVYHLNKLSRKFDLLVDIFGADHHGYLNRMKSAMMMQGYSKDILEFELVQVVRLMSNGVEVKMSKRTGNAITLRELCEECGIDAVRYFFVNRSATSHLDFDFDLAKEQSSNNPVYYAQYAHARLSKVIEKSGIKDLDLNNVNYADKHELDLIKHVLEFPKVIVSASKERNPSKMCNYIETLASMIHSFYTECKIIDENNKDTTMSRIVLAKAAKITMANALNILGVSAPESM